MHKINPFNSRSYNSKVTNWRILQLRGLKQTLSRLLSDYETLDAALNAIDVEIEQTKKAYADYVKAQFGTRLDSECALKDADAMCKNCMCWKQTRANCS